MKKTRAVVLEKNGLCYTVLTAAGEFRQVNLSKEAAIGEEVEVQENVRTGLLERIGLQRAGLPRWGALAGIAAVLIFALIFTLQWNLFTPQAVAAVSLDINPRLELTLDKKRRVLEVIPVNEDAGALLKDLDLKGKELKQAITAIIREAARQNFLTAEQDWVVIGFSPLTGENSTVMATLDQGDIERTIMRETESVGISSRVATFQVTPEERNDAATSGLTVGEFGLYQMAKQAGLEVNPDTLKNTGGRIKLLESDVIQQKLKKVRKSNEDEDQEDNEDFNRNKGNGNGLLETKDQLKNKEELKNRDLLKDKDQDRLETRAQGRDKEDDEDEKDEGKGLGQKASAPVFPLLKSGSNEKSPGNSGWQNQDKGNGQDKFSDKNKDDEEDEKDEGDITQGIEIGEIKNHEEVNDEDIDLEESDRKALDRKALDREELGREDSEVSEDSKALEEDKDSDD